MRRERTSGTVAILSRARQCRRPSAGCRHWTDIVVRHGNALACGWRLTVASPGNEARGHRFTYCTVHLHLFLFFFSWRFLYLLLIDPKMQLKVCGSAENFQWLFVILGPRQVNSTNVYNSRENECSKLRGDGSPRGCRIGLAISDAIAGQYGSISMLL